MGSIDTFECPACGAASSTSTAGRDGSLTRSRECKHCGSWMHFDNSSWISTGRFKQQIEAPGFLQTGLSGSLDGLNFLIAGRIRLGYSRESMRLEQPMTNQPIINHWDEWWFAFEDGTGQWLEEDEGSYLLHKELSLELGLEMSQEKRLLLDPQTLAGLNPGQMFTIGKESWFITEAREARLLGAEGELPVTIIPGTTVKCIDSVTGGRKLSIELWPNEMTASISELVPAERFRW